MTTYHVHIRAAVIMTLLECQSYQVQILEIFFLIIITLIKVLFQCIK